MPARTGQSRSELSGGREGEAPKRQCDALLASGSSVRSEGQPSLRRPGCFQKIGPTKRWNNPRVRKRAVDDTGNNVQKPHVPLVYNQGDGFRGVRCFRTANFLRRHV